MAHDKKAESNLPSSIDNLKIGIAFGGGGAKGFAHIHAIKAFDSLDVIPDYITGTSIGSIMGAGMAARMSGTEIEHHALKAFGQSQEVISRIWKMRPKTFSDIFGRENRFGQLNSERVLRSFLPSSLPEKIEDLQIPFCVIATNFYDMEETLINEGNLFNALAASSAIPGVFQPVLLYNKFHIDGGAVNCLPFDHLPDNLDITIAIDVAGETVDPQNRRPPTTFDSLIGANMIMYRKMRALRQAQRQPDILIQPPINAFGIQDFLKVGTIISETENLKDILMFELDELINAKLAGKTTKPKIISMEPGALARRES